MSGTAPVTIIVPMHGEVPHLDAALRPLIAQLVGEDELLLVDNGVDAAVDLGAVAAQAPGIRVIDARDTPGAGPARNAGIRAAAHEHLLFCDADDVAGDGYVDLMRTALVDHPVVAARESYGLLNAGEQAQAPDAGPIWHWRDDPAWPFAGSCALGTQRSAITRIGGFDGAIPALEDIDLLMRFTIAGYPLHGVDDAVMHIRHRGTVQQEHQRQITHGRASAWLDARYKRYGAPTENPIRNALGWVRHGLGLLSPATRRTARETLGWKRGRLVGGRDVRVGDLDLDLGWEPEVKI